MRLVKEIYFQGLIDEVRLYGRAFGRGGQKNAAATGSADSRNKVVAQACPGIGALTTRRELYRRSKRSSQGRPEPEYRDLLEK